MQKTTSQKLSKRLSQYGALSVAIAGVTNVNAQGIIYNDIPDYSGYNPDPYYIIDLNSDTIGDLVIVGSTFSLGLYAYVGVVPYSSGLGSFLGSQAGSYVYPFALNSGDPISAGQSQWFGSNFGTMNFVSCFGGSGGSNWCGATDKYLGLRFKVLNGPGPGDDQTFYGWARLDVSYNAFSWTIKDFAYNSTPDAPINAGQTTLGIDDKMFSEIKVVALNKSIGLYNLPETASYNVYSMTGQEVLKGITDNRDYVIEAPSLSSGVYVLELTDTNSNGVIRKKVVLQ